jgi:hypothetical protein
MPAKTVGQAVLKFGTDASETYGLCENISRKPVAEKEKIKDGVNDTIGLVFTDEVLEVSADFTPLSGATVSVDEIIGSEATIGDDTFIVEDAEEKYSKGKAMAFSIKGTVYPNLVEETPST